MLGTAMTVCFGVGPELVPSLCRDLLYDSLQAGLEALVQLPVYVQHLHFRKAYLMSQM